MLDLPYVMIALKGWNTATVVGVVDLQASKILFFQTSARPSSAEILEERWAALFFGSPGYGGHGNVSSDQMTLDAPNAFVFSGILKCGRCGVSMHIESEKVSSRCYCDYYTCHELCSNRHIPARELDTWLTDVLIGSIFNEESQVSVIRELHDAARETKAEIKPLDVADLMTALRGIAQITMKKKDLRYFFSLLVSGIYVEDDQVRVEYKPEYLIHMPGSATKSKIMCLDDLRAMGMHQRWLLLAEKIGLDAFLTFWNVMDENPTNMPGTTVYVSMPRRTRLLRYQRNRFIQELVAQGLGAEDIRHRIKKELCEDVSVRHIDRISEKFRSR